MQIKATQEEYEQKQKDLLNAEQNAKDNEEAKKLREEVAQAIKDEEAAIAKIKKETLE